MPSSLVSVEDPWKSPFAAGLFALGFSVPKLSVTMKKSGQLPLYTIVSLKWNKINYTN